MKIRGMSKRSLEEIKKKVAAPNVAEMAAAFSGQSTEEINKAMLDCLRRFETAEEKRKSSLFEQLKEVIFAGEYTVGEVMEVVGQIEANCIKQDFLRSKSLEEITALWNIAHEEDEDVN